MMKPYCEIRSAVEWPAQCSSGFISIARLHLRFLSSPWCNLAYPVLGRGVSVEVRVGMTNFAGALQSQVSGSSGEDDTVKDWLAPSVCQHGVCGRIPAFTPGGVGPFPTAGSNTQTSRAAQQRRSAIKPTGLSLSGIASSRTKRRVASGMLSMCPTSKTGLGLMEDSRQVGSPHHFTKNQAKMGGDRSLVNPVTAPGFHALNARKRDCEETRPRRTARTCDQMLDQGHVKRELVVNSPHAALDLGQCASPNCTTNTTGGVWVVGVNLPARGVAAHA